MLFPFLLLPGTMMISFLLLTDDDIKRGTKKRGIVELRKDYLRELKYCSKSGVNIKTT